MRNPKLVIRLSRDICYRCKSQDPWRGDGEEYFKDKWSRGFTPCCLYTGDPPPWNCRHLFEQGVAMACARESICE